MNHKQVAKDILTALGEDNIQAAAHCATRLRLVLKDDSKINQQLLDNQADIKGTFKTNGQFQIIVGPGDVDVVYDELVKLTGVRETSTEDLKAVASEGNKPNPLMAFIKILSDIFVPIVPALVAGGLLMALNNLLTAQHLFGPQSVVENFPAIKDLADIINLMASAPFAFLPILVGFSATKRFGGNPYLGAAMGMVMVMPSLVNGYGVANAITDGSMPYWNIFGLNVAQAGYQGSVLPVLAVSWILATLEKFFHKRISKAFDFTFTPMLAIIITGFLTFILVGPLMRIVSDGLTDGLVWLYETTGFLGMGIFGLFYSPIVITGLHQSFPAIETTLLAEVAKTGGSFIFPVASMANIAQGAACLAVFFITKNDKQKSLASSASISALLGITEPAIFGINLKLKFPFVCGMIASGIASAFIGLFHVLAVAMGPASVIGFISISPKSIPVFMLCSVISFVLAFVFTFMYGKKVLNVETGTSTAQTINEDPSEVAQGVQDEVIYAPVSGQVESLRQVKDQVFSAELMGKGAAIIPLDGTIYAPCDGVIEVAYETKHAYGIKSALGSELLIHVGIDTVELKGTGFTQQVTQGQVVKRGDVLGTFDKEHIQAAGYDATVMVIVTNTLAYGNVEEITKEEVGAGEALIALTQPVKKND
ncbi:MULTISPECIES: sucrose-specific PTS transporter subunit IIBC [Carnobacterium]|uniref:sucrose-specific PTS transporter subunit IIBC n=1 Tax=Carnobacterium TaxID=2747 RepID=UPI001071C170|nr:MULTISPECIES: sucrose-specific PTS transporter subunit IIBC [Carnobacterium]MDT1940234.1 sucrose-specific PTS transporter subunit IIBC [Carnobacterium divergens]MDT1942672.1 sucrose-specific PTS transporter subunit IIBC [Carnobacterium divergens]MDT1948478.1 sucrose-specific PTS transporter subunit IIBC [Carnobacterium divergens]MDT1950959.1 sucrose-specific PTS transporter subunit IIBC [Carnobacterium divergens]MDT1955789.1 sucrose-specific PTS transporter subunit IIBC [Carnobacterium dive